MRIFSLFIVVLGVSFTQTSAALTYEEVLTSMKENFNQVTSAKVVTREYNLTSEGGHEFLKEMDREALGGEPKEGWKKWEKRYDQAPREFESYNTVLTDGTSYRVEQRLGSGEKKEPDFIKAFDGGSRQVYDSKDGLGQIAPPAKATLERDREASGVDAYQAAIATFSIGLRQKYGKTQSEDGVIWMDMVDPTPDDNGERHGVFSKIEFDAERGGLITKMQRARGFIDRDGNRVLTQDISLFTAELAEVDGFFYPSRTKEFVYRRPPGSKKLELASTHVEEILEMKLNPPISPEKDFKIQFPNGTHINDHYLGDVIRVGPEKEILDGLADKLATKLMQDTTPAQSTSPSVTSSAPVPDVVVLETRTLYSGPLLAGVVVVSLLAGGLVLLFIRARSRAVSTEEGRAV